MEALLSLETPLVVMGCVLLSWKMMAHIWSAFDVEKEAVTVLVTGAAGISIPLLIDFAHYFILVYTQTTRFFISKNAKKINKK